MPIARLHLVPAALLVALAAAPARATPDATPPDDGARVSTTHVKPMRQTTREPLRPPRPKAPAPRARESDVDSEREYWRHHGVG